MQRKEEQARELAQRHYDIEPGITQIIRLTRGEKEELDPDEPVKLLEVNENTVPAGVLPIHFGPSPTAGFSFNTTIVEVTPDEYQRILSQELALPAGWLLGDPIPRQGAGVAE